jgi:hypothetical protein
LKQPLPIVCFDVLNVIDVMSMALPLPVNIERHRKEQPLNETEPMSVAMSVRLVLATDAGSGVQARQARI